jgi:hypothetical protein
MVKSIFDTQSYTPDDLFIEAYMFSGGEFATVRVDLGRIAYRKTLDGKNTSLVLNDGQEILTNLSLDQLDEKISSHSFKNGRMIDLKPHTGEAVNISLDGSLKIKLYVHFKGAAKNEFAVATIDDNHVYEYKTDKEIPYIRLKDEFKIPALIAPCENGLYTNLPVTRLKKEIKEAKEKRLAVLDLTAETKPVAPDKIRPPITL